MALYLGGIAIFWDSERMDITRSPYFLSCLYKNEKYILEETCKNYTGLK
jgi:hypothetical protein